MESTFASFNWSGGLNDAPAGTTLDALFAADGGGPLVVSERVAGMLEPIALDVSGARTRLQETRRRIVDLRRVITPLQEKVERLRRLQNDVAAKEREFLGLLQEATSSWGLLSPEQFTEYLEIQGERRRIADRVDGVVRDLLVAAERRLGEHLEELTGLLSVVGSFKELLAGVEIDAPAEAAAMSGALQCVICAERNVDRVLDGCGHTACAQCATSLPGKRCHMCRKVFGRAAPFFLSSA